MMEEEAPRRALVSAVGAHRKPGAVGGAACRVGHGVVRADDDDGPYGLHATGTQPAGKLPGMRWPFDNRAESTQAWGVLTVAVAIATGIAEELATLHASESGFLWWWPTDWLVVTLIIFVIGLTFLFFPGRPLGEVSSISSADVLGYFADRSPISYNLVVMRFRRSAAWIS